MWIYFIYGFVLTIESNSLKFNTKFNIAFKHFLNDTQENTLIYAEHFLITYMNCLSFAFIIWTIENIFYLFILTQLLTF